MWLTFYTHARGWHTVHKKCEPVSGGNSLDAGIWACAMMFESMNKWGDTMCMPMNVSLRMVHFRRDAWHASVCRNRAFEPEPFYGEYCGSGVRCTVVTGCGKGTLGRALFTLSYDIVHAVDQKKFESFVECLN